ncbi:U-box domain-containing protein [Hypoxylon argillaceum]|nr:U-box domain-containing protein [Hypoxylon argillaceum]
MAIEELPSYSSATEQCSPYPDGEAVEDDSDSGLTKSTCTLESDDDPVVTIHPLESKDGVLVQVRPPVQPSDSTIDHVPCDIVLVIDVSGSMNEDAPAPVRDEQGNATKEYFGLTVLDLTKHAARTIVSTLNEGDRLGIVAFSTRAKVVQELVPMTQVHKEEVNKKIDGMLADGLTNLWAGISEGLKLLEHGDAGGRVTALMVLTDGQPNYMCPGQGYVTKLRSMSPLPAIINTFGFGYFIRSGLLKPIAEASEGNYAFIPDAGMIGTVFVHAVAHLQSTYATRCALEISAPAGMLLKTTTGKSINQPQDEESGSRTITIQLGNLQYGQSRDIYLENVDGSGHQTTFELSEKKSLMHASLTFSRMQSPKYVTFADHNMLETSPLSRSVIAYHQSRSMICQLLSSFFLIKHLEYTNMGPQNLRQFQERLKEVTNKIPARNYKDQHNRSLIEDLDGQITEALSKPDFFYRWGCHYFFSLWNAHAKQLCNSFKDAGPLMYNDNEFFIRCRDVLDKAFDNIPPPTPSSISRIAGASYGIQSAPIHMGRFNQPGAACFAASSPVLLATGREVPVYTLQQGVMVQTPAGPRRVRAMLKTRVHYNLLCRVEDLLVTPWHPIRTDRSGQSRWAFPADVAEQTAVEYSGIVCSVLLEPDGDVDAHAVRAGGVWGVTLGHGIRSGGDARAHQFLGDYDAVSAELATLGSGENGVYYGAGVRRDADTGMVCGFKRWPSVSASVVRNMDPVKLHSELPKICV